MPFEGHIVPTPEPACNSDQVEVLELLLGAVDTGITRLPPTDLWRDLCVRLRPTLLQELGRPDRPALRVVDA